MTPATIEAGITRQDINALRLADSVYAIFSDTEGHRLGACKRPSPAEEERNPFATEQRVMLDVDGRIDNYEGGDVVSAYSSVWASSGVWEILRPGDFLTLQWIRGNHSEVTKASDLAVDELYLVVTRSAGARRKELRFMLAAHTGTKNSARMVRSASEF